MPEKKIYLFKDTIIQVRDVNWKTTQYTIKPFFLLPKKMLYIMCYPMFYPC